MVLVVNINRRVFSSEAVSTPSKEAIISTQSSLSDVPPVTPPPEAAPQASGRKSWGFLKYGPFAALTGISGYAGYAT
ncbi:hypothetical protein SLEP1_g51766 [Rubroshorea leprosula]|uniref:Uncharacterized protein n=1 Tax=Rubroshorea leprosula TaxID=152421 RepID=A0AAV5M7J7_9ROSI|nr:hypothetical protein SLEP1_g51766 [Rubroshorea leprosula]